MSSEKDNNINSSNSTISNLVFNIRYDNQEEFMDEIIEINNLRKSHSHRGIWGYENSNQQDRWFKIIKIAIKALTQGYNLIIICRLIEALVTINTIEGLLKSLQIISQSPERNKLELWGKNNLLDFVYRNAIFYPISKKESIYLSEQNYERMEKVLHFCKMNVSGLYDTFENLFRYIHKQKVQENTMSQQEPTNHIDSNEYDPDTETTENNQQSSPENKNNNSQEKPMTIDEKYKLIEQYVQEIIKENKNEIVANFIGNILRLKDKSILEIINITDWKSILFAK